MTTKSINHSYHRIHRSFQLVLILSLLFFMVVPACRVTDFDRFAFTIKSGTLHRGRNPFRILATETPGLGDTQLPLEEKVRRINQWCAQGFNSIVIKISGIASDGSSIDQKWVDTFLTLTSETRRRQVGVLLKIELPPEAPQDYLSQLSQTLSDSFSGSWDVIYWFDGQKSNEAAARFRDSSDQLLTASSEGGDIRVADSPIDHSGPLLVSGPASRLKRANFHYLLPQNDQSRVLLEEYHGIRQQGTPTREGDFASLFDGASLQGWNVTGEPSGWRVQNGTIEWVERGGGYLRTQRRYDDFILQLDWKIEQRGNSGVFIHAPLAGRSSRIGMEIQLMGDHGEAVHKNGTGAIYDVSPPRVNPSNPAGEWNRLEITSQDSRLQVKLNDVTIQDLTLEDNPELRVRLRQGFIMLQDHGSAVSFRNIRIKELQVPS